MGFLSQAFGLGDGGDQESDKHVPPTRRQPPDKDEKERIRKHYEEQEEELGKDEPRDGKIF